MTSLLDVGVLISLLDANHEYHMAVMGWWKQNEAPWASCPITQNGYLRIVTQPKYANTISVNEAVQKLTKAVSTTTHVFLSDDISLLDKQRVAHEHIQGPMQITDIYLLALSVAHGARFVTLDTGISHVAALQATNASVHVIKP